MLKHATMIVFIAFIAIGFFLLVTYGEEPILSSQVTTPPGMLLDEWLQMFRIWASVGIGTAWAAVMAWYLIAAATNMNDWTKAGSRRVIWAGFFVVSLLASVAALVFAPRAQEGNLLATAFYFANTFLVYSIASTLFSPSSFKYTPVGATFMRRHW